MYVRPSPRCVKERWGKGKGKVTGEIKGENVHEVLPDSVETEVFDLLISRKITFCFTFGWNF
jgi:hypothetical protein